MTKDFKNITAKPKTSVSKAQKSKKNKPAKNIPGWIWLLAGLVIGSFVSFLVYLKTSVKPTQTISLNPTKKAEKKEMPAPPAVEKKEHRFSFYDILPNRHVNVPVEKTLEPRVLKHKQEAGNQQHKMATPSTPTTSTPAGNTREREIFLYELHAGSFVRFKDADKRKANLAFLGVQAKIYTAKSPNNNTVYRVVIGPYADIGRINDVEKILKENSIHTVLVKTRG